MAAVSASYAQVAITGGVDFTFGKSTASSAASTSYAMDPKTGLAAATTTPAGAVSKGLAATDAYIDVGVTEDLGGGLKAIINMEFNSDGGWGANNYSGDKNITLAGASGSLTLANTRSGGILNAIMLAPEVSSTDHWSGANSGVMSRAPVDAMVIMLPAMGAFTPGYKYVEKADGYGTPASVTHVLYGKYAQGPLTAVAEYNILTLADGATPANAQMKRLDATVTYDAGVAKFALGIETAGLLSDTTTSTGAAATATLLSAVMPVGSHSIGMNWGKRDAASFTEFAGQYNFSKLTYVAACVGTIGDQTGFSSDTFGVRLGKNF